MNRDAESGVITDPLVLEVAEHMEYLNALHNVQDLVETLIEKEWKELPDLIEELVKACGFHDGDEDDE